MKWEALPFRVGQFTHTNRVTSSPEDWSLRPAAFYHINESKNGICPDKR